MVSTEYRFQARRLARTARTGLTAGGLVVCAALSLAGLASAAPGALTVSAPSNVTDGGPCKVAAKVSPRLVTGKRPRYEVRLQRRVGKKWRDSAKAPLAQRRTKLSCRTNELGGERVTFRVVLTRKGQIVAKSRKVRIRVRRNGEGTSPAAQDSTYSLRTASSLISPPELGFSGYWKAGYRTPSPAEAVASGESPERPLETRVVVFQGSAGTRAVVITADILGWPIAVAQTIRTDVAASYGVLPENILLNASHTHSGPVLAGQPNARVMYGLSPAQQQTVADYTGALTQRVLTTVDTAFAATPVEGTLRFGVETKAEFCDFRVLGTTVDPHEDDRIWTLAFYDQSDRPVMTMFSTGCHPVANNGAFDADWVGEARDDIEAWVSATYDGTESLAVFLQGAAGDREPTNKHDNAGNGLQVADTVTDSLEGKVAMEPVQGAFRSQLRWIDAPLDITSFSNLRSIYQGRIGAPERWISDHASEMVLRDDAGAQESSERIGVQTWSIGSTTPFKLVAVSGEPTSGIRARIEDAIGGRPFLFAGYSNAFPGYIPTDDHIEQGTYEGGWSAVVNGQRIPESGGSQLYMGHPAPMMTGPLGPEALVSGAAVDEIVQTDSKGSRHRVRKGRSGS